MNAGVPLLLLSWFRYAVHLVLVLALVLPARGLGAAQRAAARAAGARRLDVPGHAHVLHYAELHPQAEATAINFLAPLLVLSLAPWILKEPARLSRFVAAGIAFVGVIIVIRPGGGLDPTGTVFGLLTACCFAAQFIATRRVAGDDPFTSLIWSGAVGTACLTLAPLHPAARAAGAARAVPAGLEPADLHRHHRRAGPPVPDRRVPARAGLDAGAVHLPADHQRHHRGLAGLGPFPGPADLAGHRCHLRQRRASAWWNGGAAGPPPASLRLATRERPVNWPPPGSRTMPVAFSLPTRRPRAGFQT